MIFFKNILLISGQGLSICSLFILFFISEAAYSQGPTLQIDGTVKEGRIRLEGATVALMVDGRQEKKLLTSSNGKFAFELLLDHRYLIIFSKAVSAESN